MNHFLTTPGAVCDAILGALTAFKHVTVNGTETGCLRTLKRYTGDKFDEATLNLHLQQGLPAMLVAGTGGNFLAADANGQKFYQIMKFQIVCIAGKCNSQLARISGGQNAATMPGVEDLLDWATYYGCRAMASITGITKAKPTDHKWISLVPEKYIAVAEFEATRIFDTYDDEPITTLEKLGLVHNPTDPDQLWVLDGEGDPTDVPYTDDPETVRGGVFDFD